jgi:uncharacterized damage-inducible protein DinB
MSDLTDAWSTHARIQLYVLDAVDPAALDAPSFKGRTVGHQFSHIHDVRRMWLEAAAPDLLDGVDKLGKEHTSEKAAIRAALERSAAAILTLVERGEAGGRIKGFKPSATAFVGYLVSHESYHQGDIGVRLTESGFPLDKKTNFGMWEWGVR